MLNNQDENSNAAQVFAFDSQACFFNYFWNENPRL